MFRFYSFFGPTALKAPTKRKYRLRAQIIFDVVLEVDAFESRDAFSEGLVALDIASVDSTIPGVVRRSSRSIILEAMELNLEGAAPKNRGA